MMRVYDQATVALRDRDEEACAMVQDLLPLYIDGEVSPATREQVAAHLAGCPACAGVLAGARSAQSELRQDLAQFHARPVAVPTLPAQRSWSSLLVAPLVLLICLAGGAGSMLVAHSLRFGSGGELLAGAVVGGGALTALLLVAAVLAPLALSRLWQLCAGVGTGVAAGFVLVYGQGLAQATALLLALLAIAMVIGAVLHVPAGGDSTPRGRR